MTKKKGRKVTKQPGIYKNLDTGKYDVKYCFTAVDPLSGEKQYFQKWTYGISSYKAAQKHLSIKKGKPDVLAGAAFTLQDAFELWVEKAKANQLSPVTIRNTKCQFDMICRFWTPKLPLISITERMYLRLITSCREYGYSEETIHNINGCLRKLIRLAYKNRYIEQNPIDFWDSPRIENGVRRNIIPYEDFLRLDAFFRDHSFQRLGENHYPKYRFLFQLLYFSGIRIGEAIALQYSDFISCRRRSDDQKIQMQVSITKSYNSMYNLLKVPKNHKCRKVPIPSNVADLFAHLQKEHKRTGGVMDERIFPWDHGACALMLRTACGKVGVKHYSCHDFRHPYVKRKTKKFANPFGTGTERFSQHPVLFLGAA